MIRRPPISTLSSSSAASDVYKRQRIGEAPGHALRIAFATGGTDCRVAVADLKVAVVAAAAVEAALGLRRASLRKNCQRQSGQQERAKSPEQKPHAWVLDLGGPLTS